MPNLRHYHRLLLLLFVGLPLSDLLLPGRPTTPAADVPSVLETIKKEDQAPMVIMLTNFSNEPYRRRCFQLGADYFFDKSNEFEKVIQVLRGRRPRAAVRANVLNH